MARAIWKGRIRFAGIEVPVKLYSALEDRSVRFRMLDARRHEPVRQRMVDPDTGDVVEHEEIRRAWETEGGELVMLDEEDLANLEPEPSRDITVTRFIPPDALTDAWYDRPYFLGPDERTDRYFALVEAIRAREKEGIARWVMRKKAYVGSLRVEGDHLVLITLRNAGEVIPASALSPPSGRAMDDREVKMAKQLVAAMEDELDIAAFRDEYRDRVLELVEAKAEGKVVRLPGPVRKETGKPLKEALERSLADAGKRRASA